MSIMNGKTPIASLIKNNAIYISYALTESNYIHMTGEVITTEVKRRKYADLTSISR